MTTWWLPDDCLMTAWWLPDDCLMTDWWLLGDCLMTTWWFPTALHLLNYSSNVKFTLKTQIKGLIMRLPAALCSLKTGIFQYLNKNSRVIVSNGISLNIYETHLCSYYLLDQQDSYKIVFSKVSKLVFWISNQLVLAWTLQWSTCYLRFFTWLLDYMLLPGSLHILVTSFLVFCHFGCGIFYTMFSLCKARRARWHKK